MVSAFLICYLFFSAHSSSQLLLFCLFTALSTPNPSLFFTLLPFLPFCLVLSPFDLSAPFGHLPVAAPANICPIDSDFEQLADQTQVYERPLNKRSSVASASKWRWWSQSNFHFEPTKWATATSDSDSNVWRFASSVMHAAHEAYAACTDAPYLCAAGYEHLNL